MLDCRAHFIKALAALFPRWADRLGEDHTLGLEALAQVSDTALTRETEIRIEETPTNAVTFDGDPLAYLPRAAVKHPWWFRADMTINDFVPASGSELGRAAK